MNSRVIDTRVNRTWMRRKLILNTLLVGSLCVAATGFAYPVIASESIVFEDMLISTLDLLVIAALSRFSICEMNASLQRTRQSESDMQKERISSKIRAQKSTRELQKTHTERMLQLYQLAELGRLSSGLIHDLVSPLTALSLNLDQAVSKMHSQPVDAAKPYVMEAVIATKHMASYVHIARKQLQHQDITEEFYLAAEIRQVKQLLSHKAQSSGVVVRLICSDTCALFGSGARFSQIMTNVIVNAIDAYEHCDDKGGQKEVYVYVRDQKQCGVLVCIQDFGNGIQEKIIQSVFDPFFTTKKCESGTGIGLCIVKYIMEKEFFGTVSLESKYRFGTTCTLVFPKIKNSTMTVLH